MPTFVLFLCLFSVLLFDSAIPDDQVAPTVRAILQSVVQTLESVTCKDINNMFLYITNIINFIFSCAAGDIVLLAH